MKLSLIIPCHPRNRSTLSRTLESIDRAAEGLEVERLVIYDDDSRGPSWARNRGLEQATGEVVFFCDADDEVRQGFFQKPLAALTRTGADFCLFSGEGEICRVSALYSTNAEVREKYLPAFFGYGNDDVCRWNEGGGLMARKEQGSVCLGAFRREFLKAHAIVFDERMTLFEDAAFLAECSALADKVVSIPDDLYIYHPHAAGNLATGWRSRRNWDYKFLALDFRRRLNARCHGSIWKYCEASCVFSFLELLKARYRFMEYRRYPEVRGALKSFPLSIHHPLVGLVVWLFR